MKFQGVVLNGIYTKRKDYTGFAFEWVLVLGVIDRMVVYYPCDERGTIIHLSKFNFFPDNFFKNRFPHVNLNKFVERYEIYSF